jgi:hypothetical protein
MDAVLYGSCRDIPTEEAELSLMEILGIVRLSYEWIRGVRLTEWVSDYQTWSDSDRYSVVVR